MCSIAFTEGAEEEGAQFQNAGSSLAPEDQMAQVGLDGWVRFLGQGLIVSSAYKGGVITSFNLLVNASSAPGAVPTTFQ